MAGTNIFQVSMPKSGSHLLSQMLGATSYPCLAEPTGLGSPRHRATQKILDGLPREGVWWGHMPYREEIVRHMSNFVVVFLTRDPRDIVISHAFFVEKTRDIDYFVDEERRLSALPVEERIEWLITNWDTSAYDGWFERADVFLKYRDLREIETIEFIAALSGRPVGNVRGGIGQKSYTFRKGIVGDWRNHFTDRHVDLANKHLPIGSWGFSEKGI